MKNNLKKISLLLLCLILCTCSCFTVEASAVNLSTVLSDSPSCFSFDYSYDNLNYGRSYEITLESFESDVHAVMYYAPTSNDGTTLGILLVSSDYFTFARKQWKNSTYSGNPQFSSQNIESEKHAAGFYYCSLDFVVSKPSTSISINDSSMPMMDFYSVFGTYLEIAPDSGSLYILVSYLYNNGFVYDDGTSLPYGASPSADIEVPSGVRLHRYYADHLSQYVCDIDWDLPEDDNLRVEMVLELHWKENNDGIIGNESHVYKKYTLFDYEDEFWAYDNSYYFLEDTTMNNIFHEWGIDLGLFQARNISNIYLRYAKEVDGEIRYSLWNKIDYLDLSGDNGGAIEEDDLTAGSQISGSFDENGEWKDQSVVNGEIVDGAESKPVISPGYNADGTLIKPSDKTGMTFDSWDDFLEVFNDFGSALKGAFSFVGEFPQMVSQFFSFMPPGILSILALGLIMAVVLRFLGR